MRCCAPHFYALYMMFVMMATGGLMVTAYAGPLAREWNISLTALTAALALDRISNRAGRIFWDWVSDRLGREVTMATAFILQAACLVSVLWLGTRNATSNYSFLYTATGVASIFGGGLAAILFQQFGSWSAAFYGRAALALTAGLMALWLRVTPLPRKAVGAPAGRRCRPRDLTVLIMVVRTCLRQTGRAIARGLNLS